MVAAARGRLIAVDGADIPSLATRARAMARRNGRRGGVSLLDASGIFSELGLGGVEIAGSSPRTALLLYAADLAFRLRWQIEPALAAGRTVVAAPYVLTAVECGRAAGVPAEWTTELLRFAPAPALTENVSGRKAFKARTISDLIGPGRRRR